MTLNGWLQIGAFFLLLLASVNPLGTYMAHVYQGAPSGGNMEGKEVAVWLILVTVGTGAMTFLPALALGPVVEHLLMVG